MLEKVSAKASFAIYRHSFYKRTKKKQIVTISFFREIIIISSKNYKMSFPRN